MAYCRLTSGLLLPGELIQYCNFRFTHHVTNCRVTSGLLLLVYRRQPCHHVSNCLPTTWQIVYIVTSALFLPEFLGFNHVTAWQIVEDSNSVTSGFYHLHTAAGHQITTGKIVEKLPVCSHLAGTADKWSNCTVTPRLLIPGSCCWPPCHYVANCRVTFCLLLPGSCSWPPCHYVANNAVTSGLFATWHILELLLDFSYQQPEHPVAKCTVTSYLHLNPSAY
jgi:hypothetical protein